MKKEVKNILKNTRMVSPVTAYYLSGVSKAKQIVDNFIKRPSFIDRLK